MSRSLLFASRQDSLAPTRGRPRAPTFWGHVTRVLPALTMPPRTFIEKLGVARGALECSVWCLGEFGQCRGKVLAQVPPEASPETPAISQITAVAAAATGVRPTHRNRRSDTAR